VNEINFPSVYPQIPLKRLKRFSGRREEKTLSVQAFLGGCPCLEEHFLTDGFPSGEAWNEGFETLSITKSAILPDFLPV
jgi:hypothetical protein